MQQQKLTSSLNVMVDLLVSYWQGAGTENERYLIRPPQLVLGLSGFLVFYFDGGDRSQHEIYL